MKSFALLRTNVGLTTNIKITIDSEYGLSLDSILSSEDLDNTKFKKVKFSKSNFYDELVPYFFKNLPPETAFSIKYDNDVDTMSTDFSDQFDEIYQCGARNIQNNKDYVEEYEYFAPLYIKKNNLPKKFIIFRVDGPGLGIVNRKNFDFEIVKKFKTVKLFDLTTTTRLGQWLELNFTLNKNFPDAPLEIDFRNLEFSKWNGIDYNTGGYSTRSVFLDDYFEEEKEIFELEKLIFDSFKNNKIVFPNILNLNFLFDDEPSTPDEKRKWSINRYFGFYLEDMERVTTLSPYITPFLRGDVEILSGNILLSPTNGDPFVEGFSFDRPFYIEYLGDYYRVEQYLEEGVETLSQVSGNGFVNETLVVPINTKYRIISDIDLTGKQLDINKNFGYIRNSILYNYDNTEFQISGFTHSDVWLIEIDGVYHNLIEENSSIKIVSDYSFTFNPNDYVYKVGGVQTRVNFVVDFDNPPKYFNIWRLKFSDIKDFDTRIVDTEYSKFEYEKVDELTLTDESKMYVRDLTDNQIPGRLEDIIFKDEVENIPVSSEYTANHETFKLESGDLSQIWRKNPVYCRWSFQNSLSSNDYPYLLNNSEIFEDFNRTANPVSPVLSRVERNLDYFYTINSSTSSYLHHTLHVEKLDDDKNIDSSFTFELAKYLNLATYSVGTQSLTFSTDYFSLFFEQNQKFNNGQIKINTKKFSEFNKGDKSIPNQTLFRGIKFSIYDVDSLNLSEDANKINTVNLKNLNTFEDYKFSILLSDNNTSVGNNGQLVDSNNGMNWMIIENWQMDKTYATGSIVIFDGILYEALSENSITQPALLNLGKEVRTAPYNSSNWTFASPLPSFSTMSQPIFWSPNFSYTTGELVYNHGNYYYYDSSGTEDFWNPNNAIISGPGYTLGDVVLYKDKYYISLTSSNIYSPDYQRPEVTRLNPQVSINSAKFERFWQATQSQNPNWRPVPLWSELAVYNIGSYVFFNDIVYKSVATATSQEIPGVSSVWVRRYSLQPDTEFIYKNVGSGFQGQQDDNPIIEMNGEFYLITSNDTLSTLDNGINIYINKKWKNILININISDNTLINLSGVDRDYIYKQIYSKLSAFNFINAINDISNKYDFTDYVNYIIISEDGTIKKYSLTSNLKDLPYYIQCEIPDEFSIKVDSLTKKPVLKPQELNVKKLLKDNKITRIGELNYYNNSNIASTITANNFPAKVFPLYHGNKNIKANNIFRFSGYYMPLFYEIDIFSKDTDRELIGNYKFDTTLTNFGVIRERKSRKINKLESILKLSNVSDLKSVYPMVDEFGLIFEDDFIFQSTWDFNYHIESYKENSDRVIIEPPIINTSQSSNYGQVSQSLQNNQTL